MGEYSVQGWKYWLSVARTIQKPSVRLKECNDVFISV